MTPPRSTSPRRSPISAGSRLAPAAGLATALGVTVAALLSEPGTSESTMCRDPDGDAARSCCAAVRDARAPSELGGSRDGRTPSYTRTIHTYRVPDVVLVDQHGERVRLRALLERPGLVAVNFIFTTCTTICPAQTATFSGLEKALGEGAHDLQMVSISLDPEHDSPPVLNEYATRYRAGERWTFLTGEARQLAETYRAFRALVGSKFAHKPFSLFKPPGAPEWVRLEGLVTVADLVAECRRLAAAPGTF